MKSLPYKPEAYQLMHDGSIALAEIEHNGIRIDVGYVKRTIASTTVAIEDKQKELAASKVMRVWRKRFRTRTNFNSPEQLGKVLFDDMGYKSHETTATGKYKTSEDALSRVDDPFVKKYLAIKKLQKGIQFLKGIQREVCDGFLHPNFSLNGVVTFRSASSDPNFQNMPVRNALLSKAVRGAIIARRGRHLVEIDYGGIEVKVACCYHQDPTMVTYLNDKTKDMHRDAAMECYLLPKNEVTKHIRYAAKNRFVFPQFYGSWWLECAAHLWHMIDTLELKTTSGVPLRQHLKEHGITKLGTQNRENPHPTRGSFEEHIQRVERRFWEKRFQVYAKWKKDWYNKYLEKGWFPTKTGFICQGAMARNDVVNYPIQGAAFHCLLWSLIELNKELRRSKMKSLLIGQIHDSIIGDVPDEEVDDFTAMTREIMIDRLMKAWKWITVPLEIEMEMSPVGGSWFEKEGYKIQ